MAQVGSSWRIVTQGPASHVSSLQQEAPQCMSMGWSDGRERKVEQFEYSEERLNWRFNSEEKQPAVSGQW